MVKVKSTLGTAALDVQAAPAVAEGGAQSSLVPHTSSPNVKSTGAGEVVKQEMGSAGFELHRNEHNAAQQQKRAAKQDAQAIKAKRSKKGDTETVDGAEEYLGPWAGYSGSSSSEDEYEEPAVAVVEPVEPVEQEAQPQETETTEFFGKQLLDYQGRSYLHPPTDVGISLTNESRPHECFVPKKCIHTWKGHANGVSKLELFPNSFHLLLSAGNDNRIYLWELYHQRRLLRGYYGHSKPIKDICFNNDGSRFLSSGYDRYVKLWDTETGECLQKIRLESVANVVKFNPANNNEFLAGLTNKKIQHYDLTTQEVIQTYDQHLGAIISISFVGDKKFMSTSEDKTAKVWELQINIPVKIISELTLHSMPFTKLSPSGEYIIAQSMDNSVLVFSAHDKFKRIKNKVFKGHNCAGYGIGVDLSSDNKVLVSGDSGGFAVFWDWKKGKVVSKLKIDSRAITQVLWNPKQVSRVVFAGSSGKIYYYE